MTQHSAELCVSIQKPNLTWSYIIQGVAEAPADSTLHTFTVRARESYEDYYTLSLDGLVTNLGENLLDSLSCSLEVPQQYQAIVNRCFDIMIADNPEAPIKAKDKAQNSQVSLRVRLAPLRPFVALCNLVITRATGGRWRFDVKLDIMIA